MQHGVTLIGSINIPSSVASDASSLYAKNLSNFMELIINNDNGSFELNMEDEIVAGTLVSSISD
jgi:NAD(P) transhydrogenase subunit alpha